MPAPRSIIEAALAKAQELHAAARSRWERSELALTKAKEEESNARSQCNRLSHSVSNLEEILRCDSAYLDEIPL